LLGKGLLPFTNSYIKKILSPFFVSVENFLELDDEILEHRNIIVHRNLIRNEVVEIFQDPRILNSFLHVTIIGNDGNPQTGSGRGVVLDLLTNFWQHVFDSLTLGTQEKVPSIRHDYQKSHWQAIACVWFMDMSERSIFPYTYRQHSLQLPFLERKVCPLNSYLIPFNCIFLPRKEIPW
jgi:hypothetical protein